MVNGPILRNVLQIGELVLGPKNSESGQLLGSQEFLIRDVGISPEANVIDAVCSRPSMLLLPS